AAVDVFDATQQLNLELMIHYLKTTLQSAQITTHEFSRGVYGLDCDKQQQAELESEKVVGLRRK
ncbi:MAG: hypothetical protein V4501_10370, partial [Pseudomonadota bacterium]